MLTETLPYFSIYGGIVAATIFASTIDLRKYNRFFLFSLILVLVFFSGFRWQTGTDWIPYKELFDSLDLSIKGIFNIYHFEIGYVLLNAIVLVFSNNYTFFLLIDSFFALFLIYIVIDKTTKYKVIPLLVFFTNFYLGHYLGSNRRIIAIGFLLNAFYAFYNRKYFLYVLLSIFAILFHGSSIIGLSIVFIARKRIPTIILLLVMAICIFIGISNVVIFLINNAARLIFGNITSYIIERVLFYTSSSKIAEDRGVFYTILGIIKRIIFVFIFLYFIKHNKINDPFVDFLYNVYFFAVCFYMVLNGTGVFMTLTTFFTIVEIVIWGRLFEAVCKNDKKILLLVIIANGFLQIYSALFSTYSGLYLPYISVFDGVERYQ